MDIVHVTPELNLYDNNWPIWTYQEQLPPAKFIFDDEDRRGMAIDSIVSGGCIVSGAAVRRSLLFSDVRIDERSVVEDSVILPKVRIGRNAVIKRAILDKRCRIPDGMRSASIARRMRAASTSPRRASRWSRPKCSGSRCMGSGSRNPSGRPGMSEAAQAGAGLSLAHAPAGLPRPRHGRIPPAVDLPARPEGLHRHGGAPGAASAGARRGELRAGAARPDRGLRAAVRRRRLPRPAAAPAGARVPRPSGEDERALLLATCLPGNHARMVAPYPRFERLHQALPPIDGQGEAASRYLSGAYFRRPAGLVPPGVDRRDRAAHEPRRCWRS
jgi:hypothetical protein